MPEPTCTAENCTRPRSYRLWCQRHYELNRPDVSTCSVEDCQRVSSSRGWCRTHYERWRRLGTVELPAREQKLCGYKECDRPADARGWCQKHYLRWKNHGSPDVVLKPSGPKGKFGELSPSWRGADIGYSAAHVRVVSRRGQASLHVCTHCGGTAAEWAYDHKDPDEMTGDEGHGNLILYSADPTHYIPLCALCHRRFDREHRDAVGE